MKKSRFIILLLSVACVSQVQLVAAQTAEVQQLALNIEKLSQLKQILSDMKKGYEVINKGYTRVKSIAEGDFNLHQGFLDGLLAVNPEIRRYGKVADIIRYQAAILSEYRSAYARFRSGGNFTPSELEYMGRVYGNLFEGSLHNIDQLTLVLTSGELRMSDDERLKAIDGLYDDMQQKISLLRKFNRSSTALHEQRQALKMDAQRMRILHGGQ